MTTPLITPETSTQGTITRNPELVYLPYLLSRQLGGFSVGLASRVGFAGIIFDPGRNSTEGLEFIGSEVYKIDGGDPILACRYDGIDIEEQRANLERGKLAYDYQNRAWIFTNENKIGFITIPLVGISKALAHKTLQLPLTRGDSFEQTISQLFDILKNPGVLT